MFKKLVAIALTLAVFMGTGVTAAAAEARFQVGSPVYTLNGAQHDIVDGVEPFIEGRRTMLPLHTVAEIMNAELTWNPETRTARLQRGEDSVVLTVGEELPDGMGTPVIRNGRTFVPVAFVAEQFGAETSWDADARAVYITGLAPVAVAMPLLPADIPPTLPDVDVDEDEDEDEDEEDYAEETDAEETDVYAKFNAANEALMEAGSFRMVSENVMVMEMVLDDEELVIEMTSVMYIDQVIRSETEVDMRMEMVTSVAGHEETSLSYFRDGVLYMEILGEWIKMDMPVADMLEQTGVVTFPEEAITHQAMEGVDGGYAISFTVDGAAMTEMMAAMFEAMEMILGEAEAPEVELSDVVINAVLDADGMLASMILVMGMSMEVEGVVVVMTMEMVSEIVQIGGVEVAFPELLDEL